MSFTFEKLIVYQKSLDVVQQVETLNKSLNGQVSYSLLDQLSRASLSVPLNIAEGNGRWHKNEKRQFLRIAQGSVFEMVPIFQIIHRRGFIEKPIYHLIYDRLEELAKMLSGLIKAVEELKRE